MRAYTSGQIITVAAAVYHREDSIIFALCVFSNRVFCLFRLFCVAFDTRYLNISSYIPFLAMLVIIDKHSKWTEAIPLRTATAATTIEALRRFFASFGLLEEIVIDNRWQQNLSLSVKKMA